jgi:hypothetical protein
MNDYSSLLYSEKSVLATDCYDLTPLTYEERGMLSAKNPTENGFLEETRFLEKKKLERALFATPVLSRNSILYLN